MGYVNSRTLKTQPKSARFNSKGTHPCPPPKATLTLDRARRIKVPRLNYRSQINRHDRSRKLDQRFKLPEHGAAQVAHST
jgi:hypothetical protein